MSDLIYWIILGFIAGALSGMVVGGRTARGCLPSSDVIDGPQREHVPPRE